MSVENDAPQLSIKTDNIIKCRNDEIEPFKLIKEIDNGVEYIYLVDDNGFYTGQAITKDTFSALWKHKQIFENITGFKVNPIANNIQINGDVANAIFCKNSSLNEIPIIMDNRIISVMTKKRQTGG